MLIAAVDTTPTEDYLVPNKSYPSQSNAPPPLVDEDGYLTPNSQSGYIDVLAEEDQGKMTPYAQLAKSATFLR